MEEHQKILEMLEKGTLKAEDASRLFEALKIRPKIRKFRHMHKHMSRMMRRGFRYDPCAEEEDCSNPFLDSGLPDCIGPIRIKRTLGKEEDNEGVEENSRIIKMLKEGKITADEASQLIKAVRKSFGGDYCVEIGPGFHDGPWFSGRSPFSRHHFGSGRKRIVVKLHPGGRRGFDCCE